MRLALATLLLATLAVVTPLAQSGGTLYDRHVEVNVGQPFRHLFTTQVDGPSTIVAEITCWERAIARVVVISMAPDVSLTACAPFSQGTAVLHAEAGAVRILVMGEGLPADGEVAVFKPGYFEILVYAQDP